MANMTRQAWQDRDRMIAEPEDVVAILRNSRFETGQILPYLDLLADTGLDLPHLRAMARHSFVFISGRAHLELRRKTARAFSAAAAEAWHGEIRRGVALGLRRLRAASDPDLVADYADPAFLHVIRVVTGLEQGDDTEVLEDLRIANGATEPMLSMAELRRIDAAMGRLTARFAGSRHRSGSLLADLAPPGRALSQQDPAVNVALSVALAGHTMAQSLAVALEGLLLAPQATWAAVAAPGWAKTGLDTILSRYPSTLTVARIRGEGTAEPDCPFAAGQTVVMDMVAANARLRARQASSPPCAGLSFGAGVHKCPGAPLARRFIGEALPALARAFPDLTLHRERIGHVRTPLVQYPNWLPCDLRRKTRRRSARMVELGCPSLARAVVNDDRNWGPPAMVAHLEALSETTGANLEVARRLARNALFFLSGSRHAEARRAIASHLGGNRLDAWQPLIDQSIASALDRLNAALCPDLVADVADPLFKTSVQPILGIASSAPDRFDHLAPRSQDLLEPWLSHRHLIDLQEAMDETLTLMQVPEPAPDAPIPLLTALTRHPPPGFDTEDLKALVLVLYGASFNIGHTLANILHHLLSQPPEIRPGAADRRWVDQNIDRLIALCASPKYIYRVARGPTQLDGLALGTGETLRLKLASINRAGTTGHLAFGHGLHRCVGAALSKRILRAAVPAIFQRFPDLRLDPCRHHYAPMSETVALSALPCRFPPAPRTLESL